TGQLLWALAQVVVAVWAADRVWRLYGGPVRYRPAEWLAAVAAFPLMHIIFLGQTGGWILLGLMGLPVAVVTGRPWGAGLGGLAGGVPAALARGADRGPLRGVGARPDRAPDPGTCRRRDTGPDRHAAPAAGRDRRPRVD